ncbi:MAG TPA: ribosomal protein S18-alanine N-acetyltransferase [Terriglobia bacterium]|nr:ribosomal protein S18-alanine N-acetyltransferase [Terriglobia bacterium]
MKAIQVRIRKVRPSDVRRIIEIERSWAHLSHWSEDSYYRLVNDEGFTASYLAEVEDASGRPFIAGFVIFHVAGTNAEVYNIAVDARHARTGIGKQLMNTVVSESLKRYASRVLLEVRKSNISAIRFYEGFGFKVLGERKDYYSNPVEDAFVMEKNLFDQSQK